MNSWSSHEDIAAGGSPKGKKGDSGYQEERLFKLCTNRKIILLEEIRIIREMKRREKKGARVC